MFLLPIGMGAGVGGAYSGHYLLMAAGILLVPVWFVFVDARK
jgi:hypothetical protein